MASKDETTHGRARSPQAWGALLMVLAASPCRAQETLQADLAKKIDAAVAQVLEKSGAPSASIAVVQDGEVAYVRAYGTANLETRTPAAPGMRYSVGSIRSRRWPACRCSTSCSSAYSARSG